MKKLLLCTVAALTVASMSAQKFTMSGNSAKAKQSSSYFRANESKPAKQTVASGKIYKDLSVGQVNLAGVKDLKAVERNFSANAPKKAGKVQEEYTGVAKMSGNGTSPWTMRTGISSVDGARLINDVIPNPYPGSFENGLTVAYNSGDFTPTIGSADEQSVFFETDAAYVRIWCWGGPGEQTLMGTTDWSQRPFLEKVGMTAAGRNVFKYVFGGEPVSFIITITDEDGEELSRPIDGAAYTKNGYYIDGHDYGEGGEQPEVITKTNDDPVDAITIEKQLMFSSSSWYAFLMSNANDGTITLIVNDDGSITVPEGEIIYYMAFSDEDGENALGYISRAQDIKYLLPGQVIAPVVSYEPASLLLNAHLSTTGYSFINNYTMASPYVELPFTNLTTDIADSWLWTDSLMVDDGGVESTFTERDLKLPVIGGNMYSTPILVGSNEDAKSDPYRWGYNSEDEDSGFAYMFAGDMGSNYEFNDGSLAMMTKAQLAFNFAYYGFLGTPDVNSQRYSIENMILYQGKPASPLYFTGVNMLVRDFNVTEGQTFTLKCKIVKATRSASGSLTLGDVIAEADVNPEVTQMGTYNYYFLNWDEFYVEDEFGLSTDIDYLMIDDEFAIVLEGWDNGTFTAIPYGEYEYNDLSLTNTYCKDTDDETIYKYTQGNMLVGFKDAIYGYLYTEDDTNMIIPTTGGQTSIKVHPMLNNDEADTDTGSKTRLFLDTTIEGNEIPEWLTVSYANEDYETAYTFDMVFKAEALPTGVTGRTATLTFMQEGARLKVTVTQGTVNDEPDNVNAVKTTTKANVKYYSLDGREMKQKKGIVVGNGKKFVVR